MTPGYRVSRTQNRLAFGNKHFVFTAFVRRFTGSWGDPPTEWTDHCSGCPLKAGLCDVIRATSPTRCQQSTVPCRPSRRKDGNCGWFKEVTDET